MDVWYSLPPAAPDHLHELVGALDTTGIVGVTASDHLFVPRSPRSAYPYAGGKTAVFPLDATFSDPLTLAAGLGAAAPNLRFMTGVLLASLWHPIPLARQAATASAILRGRLDLGVGTGWMREEFDATGIRFEDRGRRLDEALPLMRRLWHGGAVGHDGELFRFEELSIGQRIEAPIPLFLGGHGPRAVRRAAVLGDGWVGVNPTEPELRRIVHEIDVQREAAGRSDVAFQRRTGLKGELTDARITTAHELGVDALVVLAWQLPRHCQGPGASAAATGEAVAEIVDRVRALTGASTAPKEDLR